MGSSSHWGSIMTQGQEANGDNLWIYFDLLDNNGMLNEAILMSTHNIQFHDNIS